jgi:hypothetical protein
VADRDRHTKAIRHFLLEVTFPYSGTIAIAASTVGLDHQASGARETCWHFSLAPAGDVIDGEGRRIRRLAHVDGTTIVLQVIDAIGNGLPNRILWEIVDEDSLWLLAPDPTRVLEIAHALLLLGIRTDDRLSGILVFSSLFVNVLELLITVWVWYIRQLFHIGTQPVVMLPEQPTDHRLTDTVTVLVETLLDICQATVEPFAFAQRVTCGVGRHDDQQCWL